MTDPVRRQLGDEGGSFNRQLQRPQLFRRGIGHLRTQRPHSQRASSSSRSSSDEVAHCSSTSTLGFAALGQRPTAARAPSDRPAPPAGSPDCTDAVPPAGYPARGWRSPDGSPCRRRGGRAAPLAPLGSGKFSAQPDVHALTSCSQRVTDNTQAVALFADCPKPSPNA